MSKLIFSTKRKPESIGYIGGGVEIFPKTLWQKIPNSENYQTHLLTLYPEFFHESECIKDFRISVFISLEKHILGGIKDSLTSNFTINNQEDLANIENGYAYAVFYKTDINQQEYNLSDISLPRKFFAPLKHTDVEYIEYAKEEHKIFENTGMGLDVSKYCGIFFFEQDSIIMHPKYSRLLQLLEEDIEDDLHIFQSGIGYFYLDKNIKKLKSGDNVGVFFIQNT